MIRRLFPHPWLSVTLIVTWMLLVNQPALGSLVFAIILGILIPLLVAPYWPGQTQLRSPLRLAAYVLLVIGDIVRANVAVAKIVLFYRSDDIHSAWIAVPIELTSPEAISMLAGTITLTPGTVVTDVSACGRVLLVHCLHAPDPDAVRDEIKARYEARLKRIFA
ncbi:Na+/H+ antiporter subunit E [Cereibacter azotoformans]|uniref:Multisubunit potassium/proton antiporter PhaE subunit n=1 Tax=Cereibacter azotoformans TaxID=43057 RepID=A0A2T5KEG9_9RHOB|nr:Na+/H+ antiporter subunit E [Cereibacter azotoformans]AXQ92504.1 Na+/H+ antiporter subunit E [Cereibacter sphaeroides]MBO4169919.1 Na+/H+ antiporter subunit E [Cereibacter azotoformans]PTR20819.1 multisubunit potassium/proton antiporter PhaE subunit [Cereibacter azotoformans]UIJ30780.1 Na+/H+ antiporter subunit E [Cereibacter azotoformans]